MGQNTATAEAVIISGPRCGEIVQLDNGMIIDLSDSEIKSLNEVLDQVIVALDRLSEEYRRSIEAVKPKE